MSPIPSLFAWEVMLIGQFGVYVATWWYIEANWFSLLRKNKLWEMEVEWGTFSVDTASACRCFKSLNRKQCWWLESLYSEYVQKDCGIQKEKECVVKVNSKAQLHVPMEQWKQENWLYIGNCFQLRGLFGFKQITKFKKSDSTQSYINKTMKQHYFLGKSTNTNISGNNVGVKTKKMYANA